MKRPLIPVALLFIGGILLACLPVPLLFLYAISGVLILLFSFWTAARKVLLGTLIIFSGWINLAQRTAILSPNDLRTGIGDSEYSVEVRGHLSETPYHRVHLIKELPVWSSMARIDVSDIRIEGQSWRPAYGQVISSTKEFLPDTFFAGQRVEVAGLIHPPIGPVAEGLFDYRSFLKNQGIHHQLDVKKIADWRIISSPSNAPLSDRFCAWGRKAIAMGLPVEDESLRLEWALTLGWKAALTDEVAEPFMRASTYHIFAVDGLRIAIISGILLVLLRVVRIPRAYAVFIIGPIIFFYAAMTGWPASAIRAIVMVMVIFFGWVLKRPSDLINSLFAAAFIILVWEPRQLFQAGFQLSFFVVLCIVLIQPFFKLVGEHIFKPDPFLPESLQSRWRKIFHDPVRFVVDLFLSSVAAWLGSIPLVAWYFHMITPLSGPANVLAIPLCGLVLICNLASLMFAAWLPYVAIIFNHAGWFFMNCIRTTSNWSAHWPGACFYVGMPGLFTIVLYYAILIAALTGWLFKGNWRRWKISCGISLLALWCGLWIWERPTTRLAVLPLTGGHAIYVASDDDSDDWLINCGNDAAVDSVTKPFLQAHGVNHLSNFILTHGEITYSGGAETILDSFPPRNIYLSPIHFRSPGYREFQDLVANKPILRPPIQAGDQCGPWKVLYPSAQRNFAKLDDSRLVLLGNLRGLRVLLLSDLGHAGQDALLAATNILAADIVITGLPTDAEPIDDAVLDAIQPRAIVVADSSFPANKKAGAKLKERLARRNIPVFYTSSTEAVTLSIRPHTWKLNGMDETEIFGTNNSTMQ